ncbi:hypothetical protein [Halobellus rubicundus]|uniref:DUF8124 domain-containing protein n=1 Tax=Halobellus rubicundus TaxID=2996466 RepID=A0ABD5MBF7_9EURY
MTETGDGDDAPAAGADIDSEGDAADPDADTFGVGIHVTETEFQFVVHVPADIDSGWSDPDAFQRLVERTVWERLDREATLRRIAKEAETGETVTLGRVSLRPDGTVTDVDFRETAVPA